MPNHIHILLTVPELDLGQIMIPFMRNITVDVHSIAGLSGRLFQGRYHWSSIQNPLYFFHAFKYVIRNPVKAAICEQVETYPYSTYTGLMGRTKLQFPVFRTRPNFEGMMPGPEPIDWLNWLNHPALPSNEELVKKAIRRRIFELPKDRISRKHSEFEPDQFNAVLNQK